LAGVLGVCDVPYGAGRTAGDRVPCCACVGCAICDPCDHLAQHTVHTCSTRFCRVLYGAVQHTRYRSPIQHHGCQCVAGAGCVRCCDAGCVPYRRCTRIDRHLRHDLTCVCEVPPDPGVCVVRRVMGACAGVCAELAPAQGVPAVRGVCVPIRVYRAVVCPKITADVPCVVFCWVCGGCVAGVWCVVCWVHLRSVCDTERRCVRVIILA
jgi:hypothetical protein